MGSEKYKILVLVQIHWAAISPALYWLQSRCEAKASKHRH